MFGSGTRLRRAIVVPQPPAQALEPQLTKDAVYRALPTVHMPVKTRQVEEIEKVEQSKPQVQQSKPRVQQVKPRLQKAKLQVQQSKPQVESSKRPLNTRALWAINDICDRYDQVVGNPPPVSWDSDRDWIKVLGQFVKNKEAVGSQAAVVSQACSKLTKRNHFLYHLSNKILTTACTLEADRTTTALDSVVAFLSRRGLKEMSTSIRAVKHALHTPLPQPMGPGDTHPPRGATIIRTLRREADNLRLLKQGPVDERNDAMVELLNKCATAAGRVYRLAIELEVRKLDDYADFRTKKLNIGEALSVLEKSGSRGTAEGNAGTN